MADETTDKPLADLAAAERVIDPPKVQPMQTAEPAPEMSAADRLRAFEDEIFKDSQIEVVRIGDRLERGTGSAFAALPAHIRAKHAAHEKLIETEQKLTAAHDALMLADAEHEAALAAVEAPDAPSGE